MKRLTLLFVIIPAIIFLMAACGGSDTETSSVDIERLELTEIGIVADNEDWMLSTIGQINFDNNGNIIFTDNPERTFYYIDTNGNLIQKFGSQGSGPGEFEMIANVNMIDGNRMIIPDFSQRRLSDFRLSDGEWSFYGNFMLNDDPSQFVNTLLQLSDGSFLANNPMRQAGQNMPESGRVTAQKMYFDRINLDGEVIEEDFIEVTVGSFYFDQSEGFRFAAIPFREADVLHVSPSGFIYLASNQETRIRKYNQDLELVREFEFEWPAFPTSDKDMEQFLEPHEGSFRNTVRNLIPDVKPVMRAMRVTEDDQLWVQVYGENSEDIWLVIEDDGTLLGKVEMPENTTLRAFNNGRIYTVFTDEFDIPAIKIFEL